MKRVIIVGKGNGWEDAPLLSADYAVWGVNDLVCRRDLDVVFMMDDKERCARSGRMAQYDATLKAASEKSIPVCASAMDGDYPGVMFKYPLRSVINSIGERYFSSSIDYMLALAIAEGFTCIDLYGVLMCHHSEFRYQRPSAEYWIGLARGRGIEVNINGRSSALCTMENDQLYGYEKAYEEI